MDWSIVVSQIAASAMQAAEKKKTPQEVVFEAFDGEMTRSDLSEKTGYSDPTVRSAIKGLLKKKQIEPAGQRRRFRNGRAAPLYRRK